MNGQQTQKGTEMTLIWMSTKRFALIRLIMPLFLAIVSSALAASPEDDYESDLYKDNTYQETQNILPYDVPQNHTLHSTTDVDWGLCVLTSPTGTPEPYSLKLTNPIVPAGSVIVVELYENGPDQPATKSVGLTNTNRTLSWNGDGVKTVYYSVRAMNNVEPAMSYSVAFSKSTGVNNGLATATGSGTLSLQWNTDGIEASAQGFNVLRSESALAGTFTKLNPTVIPLPPSPGGWTDYEDSGLQSATVYFYQVEYVDSTGVPAPFIPIFYGYVPPFIVTGIEDWLMR